MNSFGNYAIRALKHPTVKSTLSDPYVLEDLKSYVTQLSSMDNRTMKSLISTIYSDLSRAMRDTYPMEPRETDETYDRIKQGYDGVTDMMSTLGLKTTSLY